MQVTPDGNPEPENAMQPVPYRSPFCEETHYLTQVKVSDTVVYTLVQNNVQPANGLLFINQREATDWLRDNGFTKCETNN
jgi:hypothetical protein